MSILIAYSLVYYNRVQNLCQEKNAQIHKKSYKKLKTSIFDVLIYFTSLKTPKYAWAVYNSSTHPLAHPPRSIPGSPLLEAKKYFVEVNICYSIVLYT